jgi:predicted amidophosphoribosyltransferase
VRNVFGAQGPVTGRVLLVDDVYTSGSTSSAAAGALRRAGAARVEVLTFVRAVR